ncbi:MAG TPA: hypothetical protein EYP24_05770 [bacterium (Candidatus Stahlbacteria)]|nr:hypothetical protein [Candidatus Stahlbacteria bacterium]
MRIILPIIGCILALLTAIFVFNTIPHVQDSIAQLFQARIFLKGRLYAQSHPLKQFFDYTHMINNGRWYSQYPPGHPMLLAIGLLAGAPLVINPILAAIGIFITMLIARERFSERTSILTGIFMILSPFYIFMAGSHMSHVSGMLFLIIFFFAMFKERYILAGIGLGIAFLIRPFTAFLYAIPVLLLIRPKRILPLLFSFTPFVILLLLYNHLTNGDPFTFGYTVLHGKNVGLGFGKSAWGMPHTLSRGLNDAWDNIKELSSNLFEWPIPSVIPFLLPVFFFKKKYLIFYLIPISLLVGHIFYWYHDLCLGPRFLYESLPLIVILSAVGIDLLIKKIRRSYPIYAVLTGLFIFSVAVRVPYLITRASPGNALPYGRSFWGVDPYLGQLARSSGIKNGIVFVDMQYPRQKFDPYLWFGSAFLHNTPDLGTDVIYARHLSMEDTLLMNYYPQRSYYLYQGYLRKGRLLRLER